MVVAATWLRSTIMPSRFISRTTSRPKALRPPTAGHVGRRVRPRRVVVVGQRQVAHPEHVQHPQGAEGAADRVAALGPEQRRDAAGLPRPLDLVGGARERQPVGIRRDHAVHAVDLLERGRDGGVALQRARHEDRPELPAHPALLEAGEVGLRRRHRSRDVERLEVVAGLLARRPRQVVVTVDERVLGRAAREPARGGRRRARRRRSGGLLACPSLNTAPSRVVA